jgi:peptide/nickel transport system substrate-binding protein
VKILKVLKSKSAITKIQVALLIAVVAVAGVAGYYLMQPAQPKKEKVLVAAFATAGRNPDPAYAFADLTSYALSEACYDPLVGAGTSTFPDGREYIVNGLVATTGLAENWTVSSDGTVYTFKLRQGIKFANSTTVLTANAVKYSYDRAINMGYASGWLLGFCGMNMSSTKVIDDSTVQITTFNFISTKVTPNPFLLTGLSYVGIVNPADVVAHGGVVKGAFNDWMVTPSAGSGPFILQKYDPSTEAILVANKDYWKGAPKLDKVVVRFIPDTSTRELLIKSGEVDIAMEIPAKDIADINATQGVKMEINPMVRIGKITLWWFAAPFNNTKVREAIAHAIPYNSLIKDVMYNQATLYYSIVSRDGFGYQPAWNIYDYNLTKARQLLTEAGYPNGFSCTFTISDATTSDQEMCVVILQSELAKLGITMNIQKVASAEFGNLQRAGKLEMFISRWQPAYDDVTYVSYIQHHSSINYLTTGGYNNTAFDTLCSQSMVETNATKRLQMCYDLQKILADDIGIIPLYQYADILAMRSTVKGFKFRNSGMLMFYYLDKD